MATGTIVHNFAGETDSIIIVPHKTTDPLTDVVCTIDGVVNQTRKVYAAPHGQQSMLVEGLENVWYFFTAYRSADGVALTQQINVIAFNAAQGGAQYGVEKIEYQVDRGGETDPISGQRELRDERLLNKTYIFEERMTGTLAANEYTDRSDDGGGLDMNDRDFEPETYYFAFILTRSDLPETAPSGGGLSGVVVITEDTNFTTAAHNGKLLVINGAAAVIELLFPALATLGNCSFKITAQQGNQNYLTMQLAGGDTVNVNGEEVNAFYVGKGDTCEVSIFGNVMYVTKLPDRYYRLGDTFTHEKPTKTGALLNDGTEYDEIDYPGVVELMESLPAASVVNYTQRETDVVVGSVNYGKVNYAKWARNGSGKFKTPDRRDRVIKALKYFDNTVDASRVTQGGGAYQPDGVGTIEGVTTAGSSSHSSSSSALNGQEVSILVNTPDGGVVTLRKFKIIGAAGETRPKTNSLYLFTSI